MADVEQWSTSAAANNANPPDGWPEGMDRPDYNDAARELMAAFARFLQDPEFLDLFRDFSQQLAPAYTVSRVSDTQIMVSGADVTAICDVGRRIQITDGTTTVYGYISSATFSSPDTTITVSLDSGTVPVATDTAYLHAHRTLRRLAFQEVGSEQALTTGLHSVNIPGGAMEPTESRGAAGVFSFETTAERPDVKGMVFQQAFAATGTITFTNNPSDGEAIILNGTTWTFRTSGASGNETNIGGDLATTLDNLVSDLNGSGDANISVATYTEDDVDTLTITHDTLGESGNSYTLGDDGTIDVTRSGDALSGGQDTTYAQFSFTWPKGAKEDAAIPVDLYLAHRGQQTAGNDDFVMSVSVVAVNDSIDVAYADSQDVTVTKVAGESKVKASVTVNPGSPQEGDTLYLRFARKPNHANDNMDQSVYLLEAVAKITLDQPNDA